MRFVQVWSGNGMNASDWDGTSQCDKNHQAKAAQTDQAVAGLLADLKSRGLLDTTLVIWGGEFGRSPTSDGGAGGAEGRDHNPYGFTIWMAGGGVKGGKVIGVDRRDWFAGGRESGSSPRSARDNSRTGRARSYQVDLSLSWP